MNISWTSRKLFNSGVVDNASGQIVFNIHTPFSLGPRVTTIADARGQVMAEYKHRLGYDTVTYQGQTHLVSDSLPKDGFLSTSRSLHAPNGKTYVWKETTGGGSKLVDQQTDATVVETHTANLGIFSARHNVGIEADAAIVPYLDLFVLSFLICERGRRARRVAASSATAS
ncbi:hypothetical protein BD311DRAFT_673719 [Dichomitus squalens]|uniref:DUF6593 domain-containing protein n=2 Tax=Dichomitus squalens TaxID=114155 RepID=A0A4Q9M8U3_9APHY|nr:hypothetical protein BD311DRAFT_673719 [Dichomitus squalens]